MNKQTILIVLVFIGLSFFNGCTVGLQVKMEAPDVNYPVSQTSNFYTSHDQQLIQSNQYSVEEEFSYSFKKWGFKFPISTEPQENLSTLFNHIIEKHEGDAIVDLEISGTNPPSNSIFLFTKLIGLVVGGVGIVQTIQDPTVSSSAFTLGGSLVYLFSPASAQIQLEGKVVTIQ